MEKFPEVEIALGAMLLMSKRRGEKLSPAMERWSLDRIRGEERTLSQIMIDLEKQLSRPV